MRGLKVLAPGMKKVALHGARGSLVEVKDVCWQCDVTRRMGQSFLIGHGNVTLLILKLFRGD